MSRSPGLSAASDAAAGLDLRTTVMIKDVPVGDAVIDYGVFAERSEQAIPTGACRYPQRSRSFPFTDPSVANRCKVVPGGFDFVYLRFDFNNCCNVRPRSTQTCVCADGLGRLCLCQLHRRWRALQVLSGQSGPQVGPLLQREGLAGESKQCVVRDLWLRLEMSYADIQYAGRWASWTRLIYPGERRH